LYECTMLEFDTPLASQVLTTLVGQATQPTHTMEFKKSVLSNLQLQLSRL